MPHCGMTGYVTSIEVRHNRSMVYMIRMHQPIARSRLVVYALDFHTFLLPAVHNVFYQLQDGNV